MFKELLIRHIIMKLQLTEYINYSFPIGETARRSFWEVDAIGPVISPCQGYYAIVISIVNKRVTEDEHTWHLGLCSIREAFAERDTIQQTECQDQCKRVMNSIHFGCVGVRT
jgi:hypothetical protein